MVARSERDAEWLKFSTLCNELRSVKNSKGVSSIVEKLQAFLSDDRSRQLVHRWRSWGYLLNCLLHVLKEEMRAYLSTSGTGRKRKMRPKIPQLRFWHYLRTELETAHVAADGPMLHLDPNGRDCICQLFAFSVAVIDRQTAVEFDQSFETLVDKEAWLTVEVLVQYRVYCAVLDYKDWKNMLQLALGSISPKFDGNLVGDANTAATRARVIRFLVRNCPFDVKGDLLLGIVDEIIAWFEAGKGESMEKEADSLLLVIASTLLETLTDLIKTNLRAIGPYLLKRGVTVLEFIVKSNKARKNGLRGAPAEFLMQFFVLYQHNVCAEPEFCYLSPIKLLREMKKLVHVAMGADEINLLMTHFNSAREQRLGNALGIDDHGIRHLACTADIIYYHDTLVSNLLQTSDSLAQDEDIYDPVVVGSKRLRSSSTTLAWETVIEQLLDSPRVETQHLYANSPFPASQRQKSTLSYLTRNSTPTQRTESKQNYDSGSWLLLLLSALSRHGDYYVINRIGDLMMVMQKLSNILVVKELGKWQVLTLQNLIQLAALSSRHREVCHLNLNEHWASVWHTLLRPELPYIRVTEGVGLTRGQAGDAVLTLLNCCISFDLVSENMIEAHCMDLWNLPAFRQPSTETPVSRGDRIKPHARTSMASMCKLLSLLRHVQLPFNLPTAGLQGPDSLSLDDDNITMELDIKLLRSLFDHLREQVLRKNTVMVETSANSYTKGDWQTEISPLIYASVIQALLRSKNPLADTSDIIFTPELIRKLSARTLDECDSCISGEELNGFGIAFCMLETGLDHLSMAFPESAGIRPHAHSLPIQALLGSNFENEVFNEVTSHAMKTDEQFERLAVPTSLINRLTLSQNAYCLLSHNCYCKKVYRQSIATERIARIRSKVTDSFFDLLSEISSKLPSDGSSSIIGLRVLANSFDVGLVLAAIYASEDRASIKNYKANDNRLCALPLLKQFFIIAANYYKPSLIRQAQQSQSMSESVLYILRKLHTIILILQGRHTLKKSRHPSADPIELRIPPDLRASIRAMVSMLDESLVMLSGGADAPDNVSKPSLPRQRTGFSSRNYTSGWGSRLSRLSPSQNQDQHTQKGWDTMDDGDEIDILRDRLPSQVMQKVIGLWCFRVILLLKKDSGLSSVKKHVEAIQFEPDFVLAVAVLLCGVAGSGSLEAFITLIDYAAEEGMRKKGTLSSLRKGGPRAGIFLSQVLSVLVLAGLVYEKRHYQHDEHPPEILMDCAKRHLQSVAENEIYQSLRMARMAELQCLEVYFRLNSREFIALEEACARGLTDCDTSVRLVAARSLQTLYFMYPQGGEGIFQHFFKVEESLLDAPKPHQPTISNEDESMDDGSKQPKHSSQDVFNPRLCVDTCLSMLLSLYVSACSSQTAITEVLNACVKMASMPVSLYGAGMPSLLSRWLQAIAEFYGYVNVSDLLDTHFCALWHRFIATSHRPLLQETEDSTAWMLNYPAAPLLQGRLLLEQFPLSTLLGEELDLRARRSQLIRKLDMIVPIGVLYGFLSRDNLGERIGQFEFVDELLSYFYHDDQLSGRQLDNAMSVIGAQLTTDLLAFSFILSGHSNPKLNRIAHQMTELVEKRAPVSHLSHVVVSKMARFVIWDIMQINGDELMTISDQFKSALKIIRESFSNFDWKLINLAEVLSEFHVLLLRARFFDFRAECAINCFDIFVVETRSAVAGNTMLQRLLLSLCFQSIKHLAVRNRQKIVRVLCRLVRDSCELYMKCADLFGKYLGSVVQEISDILSRCNLSPQNEEQLLYLNADVQAELEKVIFAVCNGLTSGLGKYATEIDLVPDGISVSLDKLNATIISMRVNSSKLHQEDISIRLPNTNDIRLSQAKEQIQSFIQKEQTRGIYFYNSLRFSDIPCLISNKSSDQCQNSIGFFPDVRLSVVSTSIDAVRTSNRSVRNLYGKLAHTLLFMSSSGTFGSDDCSDYIRTSLANVLGELGALDASDYKLNLSKQKEDLSRLYQKHFHRGSLFEVKTNYTQVMYESVLRYLSSLFFEGARSGSKVDPSVFEETLKSVKDVLNVDEGIAALARSKDGELKDFLSPFESSPPSNWSSAAPCYRESWEINPKRTFQQHVKLWTSAEELDFKSWICFLMACLTRESRDPVLRACSALCAIRADMAIFLFPYALDSILRTAHDRKNLELNEKAGGSKREENFLVANAANEGIKLILTGLAGFDENKNNKTSLKCSHSASRPLQAIQLIIHSINFLRETEKARFVESNGKSSRGKGSKHLSTSTPSSRIDLPERTLTYGCLVDVDLLVIAKAAVSVKMPYSAMQYVEMWLEKNLGGRITSISSLECDALGKNLRDILVAAYSFDCDNDGIYGVNDGRTVTSQLIKYSREGEYAKALPLYDVSLQFSNQQPKTGEEDRVSVHSPPLIKGMLESLHSLGYNHLLEGYLQSLQRHDLPNDHSLASAQALKYIYKRAWMSSRWEDMLPRLSTPEEPWNSYKPKNMALAQQQMIYESLRSIAHRDFAHLQHVTKNAKVAILQSIQLSLLSFESTKDSFSALAYLQTIREIEEVANLIQKSNSAQNATISSTQARTGLSLLHDAFVVPQIEAPTAMPLLNRWRQRRDQVKNDFDKTESLIALEEILITVSKPSDGDQVSINLFLDLATRGRKAGQVAVAYRALLKLEQLHTRGSLSIYEKMLWQMQKAKLLWAQQEPRSAIWTGRKVSSELTASCLDSSLSTTETTALKLLHAKVLTTTGKWIASQRSESSQVVLEEFFQKATKIISSMDAKVLFDRSRDAAKTHFALAEFMSAMHQQVSSRVKSREWLAGKKVVQARNDELRELQTMEQSMQNDNRAHIYALNREVVYDMNERSKVEASVDQFLIGALCNYGKGLCLSPEAELDKVFHVLSLWLNNQSKADINRVFIEELIDLVPSYKFVPLSYQIISRISSSSDVGTFQAALHKLVMKMSVQHPHHTLVQLIALKNSGDVEGKGALQFRTNVGDAKAEGAKVYLAELMKTEQGELLESLNSMASAYVQLALFDTREYHNQKKRIPLSKVPIFETNSGKSGVTSFDQCLRVRSRRGGSNVTPAVLTSTIAPQSDMDYSGIARLISFEPHFSITDSGIHRPKIIYCYGSDGKRYKQLVKGHDDTRQDLVIEQVFETMNQFLMEEKSTRNRRLRLLTYRVVPLSPIAGVLEWVENTVPWGSYLVSRTSKKLSAHERYHPHEWKHTDCRQHLNNAPDKFTAFLEIQKNFTPVFHNFFLERFPDAVVWYHRRLAYVQSAAVTSIVGYILGIGDRHSQNILVHEETGELVHIDFGVVFDQGMALFTPETVPFRLTRDMVDGMGISGVDGVFSRCCEATLHLLRKKSASVVTILEVFVHDPLYRWTLSPLKALRIQGEQSTKSLRLRNSSRSIGSFGGQDSKDDTQVAEELQAEPGSLDAAARALIRVKQKLEGYEDPNGSALSIEGQVKQLMSIAQDPHNLCKLFPGWAPWL